jgi:hypothetical protein
MVTACACASPLRETPTFAGVSRNYTLKLARAALAQGLSNQQRGVSMARKSKSKHSSRNASADTAQQVRDSAQKIRPAGL